jgi:hypothetical protein
LQHAIGLNRVEDERERFSRRFAAHAHVCEVAPAIEVYDENAVAAHLHHARLIHEARGVLHDGKAEGLEQIPVSALQFKAPAAAVL